MDDLDKSEQVENQTPLEGSGSDEKNATDSTQNGDMSDGSGGPPDGGSGPLAGGSGGRNEGFERVSLVKEMAESYMGYAMSVIIGRALPDVRDGLKPAHRRCLFAMSELGCRYNRPTIKSARISGEVNGKYHPHGDQAIYDTIVRMAQDFNMRYPLVDGQGNFGSVDGDPPAAPRYTEMRMTRIADMLLADLDQDTVDFLPNYDETLTIPTVLPTRIPNLLVNGADGIAVAMATKMPPHNLGEVIDGCIELVRHPDATIEDLMEHIEGPDFPTGAIINGRAGIVEAYKTGRGTVLIRSLAEVVKGETGDSIIVTEIPFQVNKAELIARIAKLVNDKTIEGIRDIRDESDKDGLRIAIELRRGEVAETILNKLYKHTALELSYAINNTALVDGTPVQLNLKELIESFILHRREVIARRTQYQLRQNRAEGHVLEGRAVALANIDELVELIKNASDRDEARAKLCERSWRGETIEALLSREERDIVRPLDLEREYGFQSDEDDAKGSYILSPRQATAILDLRLSSLTSLEQQDLIDEYKNIVTKIRELLEVQDSEERLNEVLVTELQDVKKSFADERRTEIRDAATDVTAKSLVKPQDIVITVSHLGYAKAIAATEYSVQRRGGKGVTGVKPREDDFTEQALVTHSHNTLMFFTDRGRVYWLDAYRIPLASRVARGYPLVNLLKLEAGERVTCILPTIESQGSGYLFFATRNGIIKRTRFSEFSRPRSVGLKAVLLDDDDQLISVTHTDGGQDIILVQSSARLVRFKESDVRAVGRAARGVKGIRLRGDDKLISLIVPQPGGMLCTVSELGIGKRISFDQFPVKSRANLGMYAAKVSDRTGKLISALQVYPGDHLMVLNDANKFIRINADDVSILSRYAGGVKLMNTSNGNRVIEVDRLPKLTTDGVDESEDSDN